jgi:hypothetical protein
VTHPNSDGKGVMVVKEKKIFWQNRTFHEKACMSPLLLGLFSFLQKHADSLELTRRRCIALGEIRYICQCVLNLK